MGKCKVKDEWLKRKDPNGFLVNSWARKAGEHELFCIVCETKINIDHGFCRVLQHAIKKGHIQNCKVKLAPLQLRLTTTDANSSAETPVQLSTSSSLSFNFCSDKEKAMKAELIWAMKCVSSNYALQSNTNIKELFGAMFGDSVLENFSLSAAKTMYLITEALGPYFYQKTIKDIGDSAYTLCFDETTNESGKKEMQIAIRYWSNEESKVVEKHIQTFFLGHATGNDMHDSIMLALTNANLSLKNLLMVSCDGPNVNKRVINLINDTLLNVRDKSLIDIGTCSLHKVHNGFQKGLEALGEEVTSFIVSLYYYFDGWPARWEDFSKLQKEMGVKSHRFMKHSPSRWLTLGPAALRVLEQWEVVIKYFLKYVPLHATSAQVQSNQFQVITQHIKSNIKAQLIFVSESASFFSHYLTIFQNEDPMIHKLYDEGKDLLLKLVGKVYDFSKVNSIDFIKEIDLLPLGEIKFSEDLTKELTKMKDGDQKLFRKKAQKHYVAAFEYLKVKLQLNKPGNILSDLRCLDVEKFKLPSSEPQIAVLGKALPFEIDICLLLDEWRILKFEDLPTSSGASIDEYWSSIFSLKSACGIKYPVVTKVVKAMLSLSHGSAGVERGFSASGNVLTSDRTAMNVRGLNARLNILSGLKKFDSKPYLVPITKELLLMASNAYQSYKNHLENEKKNEERKEKEAIEKVKLKAKGETATELKKLSSTLLVRKNEEEKKKKVADKLFDEATKRLESAIKRKNFEEMTLAQGMLHGVKKLRSSEAETSRQLSSIVKNIEKKSSDITSYFKKQSKN